MRRLPFTTLFISSLMAVSGFCSPTLESVDTVRAKMKNVKLAIVNVGKGTAVRFDAGIWRAAAEYIPLLRGKNQEQIILAGNSSGAIPTLFFSCFGISPETIDMFRRHVSGE